MHLHRILLQEEAGEVEVVDHHVAEQAARSGDVGSGRRRGSREMIGTSSTAPIAPSAIRRFSAAKFGSNRRLKPIISGVPACSTTARQVRMRSEDEVHRLLAERSLAGSQPHARSGRHGWWSACRSAPRRHRAPSTLSSRLRTAAPVSAASASAEGHAGPRPRRASALGCSAALRPWILPIRPAPVPPTISLPSVVSPSGRFATKSHALPKSRFQPILFRRAGAVKILWQSATPHHPNLMRGASAWTAQNRHFNSILTTECHVYADLKTPHASSPPVSTRRR